MKLKTIALSTFLACAVCACTTSGSTRSHNLRAGDARVVTTRGGGVDVVVRPPAPKVITVPSARAGYVWAPGYWRWNGREHVWVDGAWVRERKGERWVPAHWEERGDKWHFEEGHWDR